MWFDLLHLDVCVCCYIYAMLTWLGVDVVNMVGFDCLIVLVLGVLIYWCW